MSYDKIAKAIVSSKNTPPNTPQPEKPSGRDYKKIILEVLRGSDAYSTQYGAPIQALRETVQEHKAEIEKIEKLLTNEIAQKFFGQNNFRLSKFEEWIEKNKNLLSGSTQDNGNRDQEKPNKDKPQQQNQDEDNQNNEDTTDLNENWEKGVSALISGQSELNNFFQKLVSSWKSNIEFKKREGEGAEKKFLDADEINSSALLPRIEDSADELARFMKRSSKGADKEVIINKIEQKYHIKLTATSKSKVNNLANFLQRVMLENILTSDPFSQSEMQNSWEKKILDLADQSFANNAERKLIAQKIAYHLIARHGFSTNSSIVEKKASELKDLLSQYSASIDLNETKKIVSKMLQIFHAGVKATSADHSFEASWKVPSEAREVGNLPDEENYNPVLSFPIFPSVQSAGGKKNILMKIRIVEVEKWDQGQPVETDNQNPSNTTPDLSSIKNKAEKDRKNKQKQRNEALKSAVSELNDGSLSETEKFSKLEEIEKDEGKTSYQSNKTDIQNAKKDLFAKNSGEYRKTMAKVFRKKLTDNGLTEAELVKTIEEWEKNNSNDYQEVENLEKNLNQKIGKSVAKKRVSNVQSKIEKALKSGDKGEMINALKDLLILLGDTQDDVYLSQYKNQVQNLSKDLETAISGKKVNDVPTNKGFWQPKVLISMGIGAIILAVLVVVVIRSRRKKKIKK